MMFRQMGFLKPLQRHKTFRHGIYPLEHKELTAGTTRDLTSDERARLKDLERENFQLRRANEILKKASAFFAQAELDRRPK